jgi:phosphate-selective porin OprO and OprP
MTNKLKLSGAIISIVLMTFFSTNAKAQQTSEEMINLLISKNLITQTEADSVRAVIAIKAQDDKAKQKKFNITSSKALTLNGYTQARFQSLQEPGKKDGFDIRRARLDLKGVITEKWDYRMQLDFASSPKILDATIGFRLGDYLKVTAGQFKVPFSMENLTASNRLESIDRSQVVEALVARGKDVIGNHNGRDIGLQLGGSFIRIGDRFLVEYAVGVFNGSGINPAAITSSKDFAGRDIYGSIVDNNETKDFSGRLLFHPIAGLDIGGSYYNGYDMWTTSKTDPAKNQVRKRIGGELSYALNNLSFKGEYIQGTDAKTDRSGWYAQAGYYFIPKKFQVIIKYDSYDPDLDKDKNISTNYVTCLSYYFNDFTRLQGSFTYRDEEGTQINNDVIALQLQIGF